MGKQHKFDYDLIVIGSGAGGSAAATMAAREGKSVAIIESDTFGGDSANWNDFPISALLYSAHLYSHAKNAEKFGLRSSALSYNYPTMRSWKNLAVKKTGTSGNRRYYETRGISVFAGHAHFISPNEISVNRRHLSAQYFLIATGADWAMPRIQGAEQVRFFTPRTILEEIKPPKSLLVIGGEELAVEIAQLFAIFGTAVHIVESADRLLPSYDREAGEKVAELLGDQEISISTNAEVVAVERIGLTKRVSIRRGGVTRSLTVDEILVADKRSPRIDIGLENAGVTYTGAGIVVNEHLQTSVRHIFAAGDVLGMNRPTHDTLLESQVAARNMLSPRARVAPDYTASPVIVDIYPEVARTGITADEAEARGLVVHTAIAPLSLVPRSMTTDFKDGFVKLITDSRGVLLGATIVAPRAGELIHELSLAIKYGLTAEKIAHTPHAFLSWSEAIRIAAGSLTRHS